MTNLDDTGYYKTYWDVSQVIEVLISENKDILRMDQNAHECKTIASCMLNIFMKKCKVICMVNLDDIEYNKAYWYFPNWFVLLCKQLGEFKNRPKVLMKVRL